MKSINFVTTLSPQEHTSLRKWFIYSALLIMCTCIGLACITLPHLFTIIQLKNDVHVVSKKREQITISEKQYTDLVEKNKELRKKNDSILSITSQKKNPYKHLESIAHASGDAIHLERIRLHKNTMELEIICKTTEFASIFIKRLSASELFTHIKLVSMVQDATTQQMRCIIKGTLIY